MSKPLHYSGIMSQREHLKISIKLSLMIPSQKVAPTSVMTDDIHIQYINTQSYLELMSTATPCPYTPLKAYEQFLHSLSHPGIRITQKLINISSINISLDVHKWAHSCQDKRTDIIIYMSWVLYLLFANPDAHFSFWSFMYGSCRSPTIISRFTHLHVVIGLEPSTIW